MRIAACLLLLAALAPALVAQEGLTVTVEPVVDGTAEPGKEYTLKLRFTVPEGHHAYHKDNPGYSKPVTVTWTELAGLKPVKETWPEPHKHVDEFSEEWELNGTFDIAYTFTVPADASGSLTISGKHDTQFCDADGCLQAEGEFTAAIEVAAASADPAQAEELKFTATLSAEPAKAGGLATVKLKLEYSKGYHTYHKDNPGYGMAPKVVWTETSGLKLKDTTWPEPHKHAIDEDWIEWEYPDGVTLTYSFEVPADATGELSLKGKYEIQVCDENGCFDKKGEISTTIKLETAAAPEENSAKDEHGFYLDFDYAMAQARAENKPLLVDFNGIY